MDNLIKCEKCGKEGIKAKGLGVHQRSCSKSAEKVATAPVMPKARVIQTPEAPKAIVYDNTKYLQLPAPLIEHLKMVFGAWLEFFEIGQEWREDFGGHAIYIKVPQQFSTEWKTVEAPQYDNSTLRMVGTKKETMQDIRWKSLRDVSEAKRWLDLVKRHIIDHAYQKGIRLPSTNTGYDETRMTKEQYESAIAGQKQPV